MAAMQNSAMPIRKVSVGALAGAVSTVIVFVLNTFVLSHDQQIPAEVATALATVLSFCASYFVPPAADDGVVPQPAAELQTT